MRIMMKRIWNYVMELKSGGESCSVRTAELLFSVTLLHDHSFWLNIAKFQQMLWCSYKSTRNLRRKMQLFTQISTKVSYESPEIIL